MGKIDRSGTHSDTTPIEFPVRESLWKFCPCSYLSFWGYVLNTKFHGKNRQKRNTLWYTNRISCAGKFMKILPLCIIEFLTGLGGTFACLSIFCNMTAERPGLPFFLYFFASSTTFLKLTLVGRQRRLRVCQNRKSKWFFYQLLQK